MSKIQSEGKRREILVSATLLMLFFLGYLFFSYTLNTTLDQVNRHAIYTNNLSQALRYGDDDKHSLVNHALTLYEQGGQIHHATVKPLNKLLSSEAVDLAKTKSALNNHNYVQVNANVETISVRLRTEIAKKNKLIKTLIIVMGIFTAVLYALMSFYLIRREKARENIEEAIIQESEGILNTVSEGLFLLGKDHQIGIQQSASIKEMFKQERDLEGDFFEFISQYVTQSDLNIAKDFLGLLFGDRVKEKLIKSLNPLDKVEINIARRDGSFERRYLEFNFKRVIEDEKLKHLLVSVTDITRKVELEKELQEAKDEQEAQIDLLKNILHIDSKQLKIFFSTTDENLNKINNVLENGHGKYESKSIRGVVTEISQTIHAVKGDAAALGLHHIEFEAHDFEESIKKIDLNASNLSGKDLLPLTSHLRTLFKEMNSMSTLIEKFSSSIGSSEVKEVDNNGQEVDSLFLSQLQGLVDNVSERNNVKVNLNTVGLCDAKIPDNLKDDISTAAIQLARNAIVHGGETPAIRLGKDKSASMQLDINVAKTYRGYELTVRDDGKGIDERHVIARAQELNLIEGDAKDLSLASCINYLFDPSFSSQKEASLDAGRGVGLSLVKKILAKYHGKIFVKSERNKSTQFHLIFPEA